MKATLEYKDDLLCVVEKEDSSSGGAGKWHPVRKANYAEVQALLGRPIICVNKQEGIYVDDDGNVYQPADKAETRPIAVEPLLSTKKTELETLLEASLNGGAGQKEDAKRVHRRIRNNGRKPKPALQVVSPSPEPASAETPTIGVKSAPSSPQEPSQLNIRQKLAEVRRRIGYVQKRGHNERSNYSYVTAADIAGSIGDLLSELGVVVIPSLENITYESAATRGETTRMAQVVMAYTFADVDSGEEIVARVAGQGLDPGDKAPYKAMTGALKYALLQSFLLATGDDPEDERVDGRAATDRQISPGEIRALKQLIEDTGTDLERVLAYYKVASLEEMTETTYRRAVVVLNRKLTQRTNRETVHAQD
jgi:hypothetical protein